MLQRCSQSSCSDKQLGNPLPSIALVIGPMEFPCKYRREIEVSAGCSTSGRYCKFLSSMLPQKVKA